MSTEKLYERSTNDHMIKRYIAIIESLQKRAPLQNNFHRHHVLPKAKDMFPEYRSFADHAWNEVVVTSREHFLLHWMLAKIFPGTSQSRCYYYMSNNGLSKRKSKDYEAAKIVHKDNMKYMYTAERNKKISDKMKGQPKSEAHRQRMVGHTVTENTRQKLRIKNLGKKHTDNSKIKMSISRTGKKKEPHTIEGKINISTAKKKAGLKWFNDGEQSKLFSSCPEGWKRGRLQWK